MDKDFENYIATQTDSGFHVVFQDPGKLPMDLTFEEFNDFALKYNETVMTGKEPELSDRDQLILSLCHMLLIPNNNKH